MLSQMLDISDTILFLICWNCPGTHCNYFQRNYAFTNSWCSDSIPKFFYVICQQCRWPNDRRQYSVSTALLTFYCMANWPLTNDHETNNWLSTSFGQKTAELKCPNWLYLWIIPTHMSNQIMIIVMFISFSLLLVRFTDVFQSRIYTPSFCRAFMRPRQYLLLPILGGWLYLIHLAFVS